MKTFAIQKQISDWGATWGIVQDGAQLSHLCWDELLAGCARCLLNGASWPPRAWASDEVLPVEWELLVMKTGNNRDLWGGYYTLRRGERFIGDLTPGEALAFIAAYTLTDGDKQLFHGLLTYEQWVQRFRWNRERQINGLLAKAS